MWSLGQRLPSTVSFRTTLKHHKRRHKTGSELRGQGDDTWCRDKSPLEIATTREQRWQDLRLMKRKLAVSVDEEDFTTAATLRDSIQALTEAMSVAEQYSLRVLKELHESSSQQRRLTLLSSLADDGEAMIVPEVAEFLWWPGLHKAAEDCITSLLTKHTDSEIRILLYKGTTAMRAHRYPEALADFDKITQLDPSFAEGHNRKATVLYLMQKYTESIQVCNAVLELQPYHFGALAGMGFCHHRLHEDEEALKAFEQAISINPGMSTIRAMVDCLRQGDVPDL